MAPVEGIDTKAKGREVPKLEGNVIHIAGCMAIAAASL